MIDSKSLFNKCLNVVKKKFQKRNQSRNPLYNVDYIPMWLVVFFNIKLSYTFGK